MSKDNQNFDFHWVNHKIVKNRILGSKLDNSPRNALANFKYHSSTLCTGPAATATELYCTDC